MKKIFGLLLCVLTLVLSACSSNNEDNVIKVGASPTPHAEILENIKDILEEEGYELEITVFTDYVIPNTALDSGEIDANYFQHQPYLENFNENNGTDLVSVCAVHFEPLGIYAGKSNIDNIEDNGKVGIPSDSTNGARALRLLEANGLIKINPTKEGLNITPLDIVENKHNLEIMQMEAAQLPISLADLSIAVINGNYALDAGITDKLIVTEDKNSLAAQTYANVIAVKAGNEDDPKIKALVDAITSEKSREFINETYGDSVIPVF